MFCNVLFQSKRSRRRLRGSYAIGALGPDSLFPFYQPFCDLVNMNFMAPVCGFQAGELDISTLSFPLITFISKLPDAKDLNFVVLLALVIRMLKII